MKNLTMNDIPFQEKDEVVEEQSNSSGSKPTTDNSISSTGNVASTGKTELAAHETKIVALGKMCMIFLLLTIAAGAATAVFKFTAREQKQEFGQVFEDIAEQLLTTYEINAEKIVESYETFSMHITAYAEGANKTWPFVTIPSFEAIASRVIELTGANLLIVSHFVDPEQKNQWNAYAAQNAKQWIEESYDYYGIEEFDATIAPYIFDFNRSQRVEVQSPKDGYSQYAVAWETSPLSNISLLANWDALGFSYYSNVYDQMIAKNSPMMSEVTNLRFRSVWPESFISVPVYSRVVQNPTVDMMVGSVSSVLPWDNYFTDLPQLSYGNVSMVISNTCNQTLTYVIDGQNVTYLGRGDFHDEHYDDWKVETSFSPVKAEMECMYTIAIYPSEHFANSFLTNKPILYTLTVICIFLFTIATFLMYDCFVEQRQAKIMLTAERSTAIVSSLFPQQVADKLMGEAASPTRQRTHIEAPYMQNKWKSTTSTYEAEKPQQQIAELFPSTTVMFADIVGFTAWSSEREPSQVFELLEQLYSSFDHIAKRKRVFKVETIGDCYMAAAGVLEKCDDHAIVMARFARDCLKKMLQVVRKLESDLGPSTGDLGLRIGIHSGPVTAGVLRGDKARFQLFGDTVNTAARMESTALKNKIQVSADTAALINKVPKATREIWVVPREDRVHAKGKGDLITYWLAYANQGEGRSSTTTSIAGSVPENPTESTTSDGDSITEILPDSEQEKMDRSIEWTANVLQRLLRKVVAARKGLAGGTTGPFRQPHLGRTRPLDEVVETINLNRQLSTNSIHPNSIELPPIVLTQLRDYVRKIANMYRRNFFHNFEHATHVTLSVTKLLARVVTPNLDTSNSEQLLHDYTFGITSDPLAQFAVAFSALIHDVDHPGVPNVTLVKEATDAAKFYRNQSVAEQNSVDLAWDLLAEPSYEELRNCIYTHQDEFDRFRQLVVNTVMATDIVDKELGAARKARWQKAFATPNDDDVESEEDAVNDANRKATIVLEHIIQASDVSHTMQHWHIYFRWNERFFFECYHGYLAGRTDKDPSIDWYESEIGFFDFYVIPLAKKLKECQVFGVSSEEYLNYATVNRKEWELKGRDLVKGYIEKFRNQTMQASGKMIL